MTNIKLISKDVAMKLYLEYKVPFGEDGMLHTGKKHGNKKYYLYETHENLALLAKISK